MTADFATHYPKGLLDTLLAKAICDERVIAL